MNYLNYMPLLILGTIFSPTLVYATSTNMTLMINIHNTNPNPSSLKVNSADIYLNSTDSHYHVRGTVTNMQQETKNFSSVTGEFTNKTSGHLLSSAFGPIPNPIGPGKTVGYDFDTGYTPAQLAQFKTMKLKVIAS